MVAAASLLPPPRPAPLGIRLIKKADTARGGSVGPSPIRLSASAIAIAAFTTRFSAPFGTAGESHDNVNQEFPRVDRSANSVASELRDSISDSIPGSIKDEEDP